MTSTVDKALSLLELFSETRPKLGLSELARVTGWDRSTLQRYVRDLVRRGILEQDISDKAYFLGPSLTRLAMVRERTHPLASEILVTLRLLVDATNETAHASQFIDGRLASVGIVESSIRGTRVYVDPAEALPLHATASGIAFLSASPEDLVSEVLSRKLTRHTPNTLTTKRDVRQVIKEASDKGYAVIRGAFERDVVGMSAPVKGFDSHAVGALAVATPEARFNTETERSTGVLLINASRQLSRLFGATT